jgi:ABC-2 type transport system ATP-binding protein
LESKVAAVNEDWAIEVEALVKTYAGNPPVEAVRGIDLKIGRGECFGVLGPNGAGKTTTIEILEGILNATSGIVKIFGMEWGRDDRKLREHIGVSLQETELSEKLTVHETLTLFRSFYSSGISVAEAIARVGLQDKANVWVKKLSGGQKQRLAVATAIVGDPQLIFLDEPTTGLDPVSRRQLWEIIRGFTDSGRTVLLTTHYMDEAERLCDRIAIIDAGRVIAEDTPSNLIRSLGPQQRIEVTWEGTWMESERGEVASIPGAESVIHSSQGLTLCVDEPHRVLPELMSLLTRSQVALSNIATRHATLEDVFVNLTGRHLLESDESGWGAKR